MRTTRSPSVSSPRSVGRTAGLTARLLVIAGVLLLASAAATQNTATVPRYCDTLPGNAGLAMPLRWSVGKMQVYVDPPLLPANFVGQTITGLRLRRSVLPGDVAYPAMTRTLTIRGGFQGPAARLVQGNHIANRPASAQVLFGPATVSVPATAARGSATTVGEQLVAIQFSQPLPVTAGTLYLEFETSDAPMTIATGNWVDAVWFQGGVDDGVVATVGDTSCSSSSGETTLRWADSEGPVSGETIDLALTGAPANGLALAWVGLDPAARPVGPTWFGFGASLGSIDPGMAGCHLWAPPDVLWFGTANASGRFGTTFDMPNAAAGLRLGFQAAWYDDSRAALPLSLSNGLVAVCNSAGVEDRCNTMYFPGTALESPWGPRIGQMPVLMLEY